MALRGHATMNHMSKRVIITLWAFIQTVLSTVLLLIAQATVMSGFESGSNVGASEPIAFAAQALRFPLGTIVFETPVGQFFPGLLGYAVLLLNGAMWAMAALYLVSVWRTKDRH